METIYKDGYKQLVHRKMTFDEHCKAYPTEWLSKGKKVTCYLSYIPYDYCTTTLVFFVTGHNGDEYGQFKTVGDALEKYLLIESETK